MRRRSLLLASALGLLAASGCSSPEKADDPFVSALCAPALTYASGDAKAGTVTVASLPLLAYYHYQQGAKPDDHASRLCWLPLLSSVASEQRDILDRVRTLPAPPGCPDEDAPLPPPRHGGKIIIRTTDDDPTSPAPTPSRAEPAAAAASPSSSASRPTPAPEAEVVTPAPVRARATPSRGPAPNGAKILRVEPGTASSVDVLFPLFHVARERPGRALIDRPGRGKSVVEVGDERDSVRVLPFVSYDRAPGTESLVIWPLLASGYESDASGRYVRFLYFVKIRTGDAAR